MSNSDIQCSPSDQNVIYSSQELIKMMLLGRKLEVIKYLKKLPIEESTKMRNKLLRGLDKIRERRAALKAKNNMISNNNPKKNSGSKEDEDKSNSSQSQIDVIQQIYARSSVERANYELEGKYKAGEVIGKGGFGTVMRGISIETGDFVAIKQIDKDVVDESQLPGVMKEAKILKRLNHPNILKIFGVIETPYTIYFILEYIESGSLGGLLKKFGCFPEPLIAKYTEQTLRGLEYLHNEGIIHRDIKGDNILITKDGKVKLADFGTAKLEDAEKKTQTVVGTPYWMAPEVIAMSACGPPSDIWSLGCTVIELFTGAPPYFDLGPMSALFNIVEDSRPPFPENISDDMKMFLKDCFRKDPKKRPSASQLLEHPWIKLHTKDIETDTDLESATGTLKKYNTRRKKNIINFQWEEGDNESKSEKKVKNRRKSDAKSEDKPTSTSSSNTSTPTTTKESAASSNVIKRQIEDMKVKLEELQKEKDDLVQEKLRLEEIVSKASKEKSKLQKKVNTFEIVFDSLGIEITNLKKTEKVIKAIQKKMGEDIFEVLATQKDFNRDRGTTF